MRACSNAGSDINLTIMSATRRKIGGKENKMYTVKFSTRGTDFKNQLEFTSLEEALERMHSTTRADFPPTEDEPSLDYSRVAVYNEKDELIEQNFAQLYPDELREDNEWNPKYNWSTPFTEKIFKEMLDYGETHRANGKTWLDIDTEDYSISICYSEVTEEYFFRYGYHLEIYKRQYFHNIGDFIKEMFEAFDILFQEADEDTLNDEPTNKEIEDQFAAFLIYPSYRSPW